MHFDVWRVWFCSTITSVSAKFITSQTTHFKHMLLHFNTTFCSVDLPDESQPIISVTGEHQSWFAAAVFALRSASQAGAPEVLLRRLTSGLLWGAICLYGACVHCQKFSGWSPMRSGSNSWCFHSCNGYPSHRKTKSFPRSLLVQVSLHFL
jgi:hypothetical protein